MQFLDIHIQLQVSLIIGIISPKSARWFWKKLFHHSRTRYLFFFVLIYILYLYMIITISCLQDMLYIKFILKDISIFNPMTSPLE